MDINEYLEDFDNAELDDYDWIDQMYEAIESYNEEFGTKHSRHIALRNYKNWKRNKNQPEQ